MIRTREQIEHRIKRLLDDKRRLENQLRDVDTQLRTEALRLRQATLAEDHEHGINPTPRLGRPHNER